MMKMALGKCKFVGRIVVASMCSFALISNSSVALAVVADIDTPAPSTHYGSTSTIVADGSCNDPSTLKLRFVDGGMIVEEKPFNNVFESEEWMFSTDDPAGGWPAGNLDIQLWERLNGSWFKADQVTVVIN